MLLPLSKMELRGDMKRSWRLFLIFALASALVGSFWHYSVTAMKRRAAEFQPTAVKDMVVPSGMEIYAYLQNIGKSSKAGDAVSARVSAPVVVDGDLAIPAGARLKGNLKRMSPANGKATVALEFTGLVINGRDLRLAAAPVVISTRTEHDAELLGEALGTVVGAGIGAAIGALSEDGTTIAAGLIEGTKASAPLRAELGSPVKVVLTEPLRLRPATG